MLEALKWPLSTLAGGIFVFLILLWRFPNEIKALLQRFKKAGMLEFSTTEQQKQPEALPLTKHEELMRAFDSPMLLAFESKIKSDLTQRGDPDPQKQIDALVRHLAVANIRAIFERLARLIFGSQLELLIHLNSRFEGETPSDLKHYYDLAAVASPGLYKDYSYDQYLGFLKSNNLVQEMGGRLYVTDMAKQFMTYLIQTGDTAPRPH